MAAHAAVGVDDDLAAGEAGVAHGAAYHEATGGVHIEVRALPRDSGGLHDGRNHMLAHVCLDDVHVLDLGRMLRGDDDGLDGDGLAALVAHGDLGLAVGAQVRQRAIVAHRGEALGQTAGQVMRHGHERGRLVGRVAEHHALVARADEVERVGGAAGLGIKGLVHALRDVGALLVDEVEHAAGVAVKAELGAVVPDAADDLACDVLNVDVGLGANLAGDDHGAGGDEGLAGAADVLELGGLAVGRHVALGLELGLLGQDGVEHGVGDLVRDLVGMALGDRLGGEDEGICAEVGGASRFRGGTILSWHRCPFHD
ncbi:Uncharacterised protein [Collinsella intestinalis]|nr:Uncharacterised protein [Collinsella intestinalis]